MGRRFQRNFSRAASSKLAPRGEAEAPDAAGEVADEEVVRVAVGQAGAGIEGEAGGALGGLAAGGQDVARAAAPEALGDPRAEVLHVLVADAPTVVAALDEVEQTALVRAGGVVVHGEEIAERVEGEALRVAQADAEDFQLGAVGLAAEDRAGVGRNAAEVFRAEAGVFHAGPQLEAAVAEAEVEAAVGAEGEAVEVVASDGDVDAEAGGQTMSCEG